MNSYEREKARDFLRHQENMQDPEYARAYQEMQRRKKEREATTEALKRYELGWDTSPQVENTEPKEKTAQDMRKEELTSLFG